MATNSLFINAPEHRTVPAGGVIYNEGHEGSHMCWFVFGAVELREGGLC